MVKKKKKIIKKKNQQYKSFKLSKDKEKFSSFHITQQTIYWIILLVYIVAMDLWVFSVQTNTLSIFDSIGY